MPDGTVKADFSIVIRHQLVDFRAGGRIESPDAAMLDAIAVAGGDVSWDEAQAPAARAPSVPPGDWDAFCASMQPAAEASEPDDGDDGTEHEPELGSEHVDAPRRRGRPRRAI